MKSVLTRWIILNIFLYTFGIGLGAAHYPIDFDGLRCPTYEVKHWLNASSSARS